MTPDSRIFVAGHRGLVGSAVVRCLQSAGFRNLVLRSHAELDLCSQASVDAFFAAMRPEYVFLAAAKVGGILANDTHPAEFLRDNLAIQTNVIDAAFHHGTRKLLFLGSSCIYPKHARQPMPEECLLTGALEPTNEWYAIAKIAGLKLAQAYRRQHGCDFISAMPTNLYGPNDNFDLASSHVLPALMRKAHEAKQNGEPTMTIWGTGAPRREFMHVDDCADALVFLMRHYSGDGHINVGVSDDVSIAELADLVCEVVGYDGRIVRDETKPDGTIRKLMSSARLQALGWRASIPLRQGLAQTYDWFLGHAEAKGMAAAG
jgi:GDP-L-fucose synthase